MTTQDSSTPRYYVRFNRDANSYSVFERDRFNEFNEPYCVLPLVTKGEAEAFIADSASGPRPATDTESNVVYSPECSTCSMGVHQDCVPRATFDLAIQEAERSGYERGKRSVYRSHTSEDMR